MSSNVVVLKTFSCQKLVRIFAVLSAFLPFAGGAQVLHHIAAANIIVVQNDTNNLATSVTVTTGLSINDFRIRTNSNRADYNVQIGTNAADDVTNGILMTSIDQNGRDNGEAAYPGMNYGTAGIDSNDTTSPGSTGEYWIPVFQAPSDAEYNFNVAAAWFPYSDGWLGGWLNNATGVNGGPNNHLIGNTNLVLGTHVIDNGSGKTTVNLLSFGLDSRSNAVLIVEGGKNEANFALSNTNTDGTWTITCHDDNGGVEQDYVAFVCVPITNHTVVSGRFMGDASVILQSQPYTVVNSGNGTYHLAITGVNPTNGVLIISPEGGGSANGDNMVSYQINGDGWDIQTRDITAGFTPSLQNLDSTNAVASFVFIPGPIPGLTTLKWSGLAGTNWDLTTNLTWVTTNNSTTSFSNDCQTLLDDSASNFNINLATAVSPYLTVVSNGANAYVIRGAGNIGGAGGLTKKGSNKLTLATTNNSYTGDTVISQGTLTLGGVGVIPSGTGVGNVTVGGILDLGGFNCTVNNLSGNGVIDNSSAGGAPQLKIFETTNTTFSGFIKNTSGSTALILDGGGALTLSSVNTFSGGATITNGTLVVNGILSASPVVVQGSGTLTGTGTISGSVTMADGSSINLTANSPLSTGPLILNGTVTLSVTSGVSLSNPATYVLLRHGARSGSGAFNLIIPPGLQANGFTATQMDTGTQLQLVVTPVGITGTIADVRHVVILMDENRSFDHYFGSYYGVRGFSDRNALKFTNQQSAFYQPTGSTYELPFHNTMQCLTDLNHSWPVTHATVNNGWNNGWITNKGAETMCYFQRGELPYFYALADAFTICDEYHASVLSSTFPNRISLMTGMIDPNSTGGGPEIDNSSIPGGFRWKTYPEFLQQAGVSWKVFFVNGDSGDNVLPLFASYIQATSGNPLYDRARVGYSTLSQLISGFTGMVTSNTLPSVSWIIGPGDYTEHPPWSPANGEVFLKQMLDSLAANPQVYNSTVFIFNYDENDGFFDHAMPILPPAGASNEYVGNLPIGLGIRVPAIIVSPWTRGGRVCSQVFDHTSVSRFLEKWTGVTNSNISPWRRQVSGDLTSAFDFAHPNTNYPVIAGVANVECTVGSTPTVPSPQTFPTSEAGTVIPMPLPYQANASCALDNIAGTITITMTNSGAASVHFGVYPNAYRGDGPWPFDVNTANSTNIVLSATSGKYDFSSYGPNGFQRRFAGTLATDYQKLEVASYLNPNNAGIKIGLINSSTAAISFSVSNGYTGALPGSYSVPAHTTNIVTIGSETNNGFYDVTVTSTADSVFVRRLMGRVEPVTAPAALVSSKNPCNVGDSVTFTFNLNGYGSPEGTVQFSTNGVSIGNAQTLVNGAASFTMASFGCDNMAVGVTYSGDALNSPQTNLLQQLVAAPAPVITLLGSSPMTNWLGTVFVDPGVTAVNTCAESLPVTTNGIVNSAVVGTYHVQYTAGNAPGGLATNTRTVLVIQETPPTLSVGRILPDGSFQFSFSGPATQPFRVMATTNLSGPVNWSMVSSGSFGSSSNSFSDTNVSSQSARFYRVVSP